VDISFYRRQRKSYTNSFTKKFIHIRKLRWHKTQIKS
jgi:hypothetical protein